ncbi:MAG TPA: FAD-dependent oxidoreductase, partial [Ilumatobacteraceae bacterium]|nr:FAD-dependent oxidoreductase [Ilumatobacteraceae bacterium]
MPVVGDRCDIVVLGAGPAGLAAAWYAVRRGFSVVVVDRAERVGGLAGSITIDRQSVDLGSHRLHPSISADLLEDLREVLHLELQWRPRNGRIRLAGRWLAFPLQPFDLLRNARPSFAVRVLGDIAAAPVRRRLGSRSPARTASFSGQVRRNLGPTIAGAFYEPYARKLWGVDGDRLSPELFRRRVSVGSASAIVRKLIRPHSAGGFWYPLGGFGTICTTLADDFVHRGGVLLTATQIDSIDLDGEVTQVRLRDGGSIVTRTVVSTIPSANLVDLVGAPAPIV